MNRAFTRRRTKRTNEANLAVKWKEANYLKKWVKGKDLSYLKKFQRCPELILQEYEKHLNEASPNLGFVFTSEERLTYIKQLVEWHLHLQPEFKKFLRVIGLNNTEFGKLLGYKSASSWYNSYAKVRVVRGYLSVFRKYNDSICFPDLRNKKLNETLRKI